MQISAYNPYSYSASSGVNAAEVRSTDSAFAALFAEDTPEQMLKEITKDGINSLMKWKVDQLRKQIAEKALASRGLTTEQIAAMPAEQRVQIEKQILDEVAQKLKEAINEQMKKETGTELGFFQSNEDMLTKGVNLLA